MSHILKENDLNFLSKCVFWREAIAILFTPSSYFCKLPKVKETVMTILITRVRTSKTPLNPPQYTFWIVGFDIITKRNYCKSLILFIYYYYYCKSNIFSHVSQNAWVSACLWWLRVLLKLSYINFPVSQRI